MQVGHWDEAVSRFQSMLGPSSPVRPTASTFNTIMSGYMKLGEYGKVSCCQALCSSTCVCACIAGSKLTSAWGLHHAQSSRSTNLATQNTRPSYNDWTPL